MKKVKFILMWNNLFIGIQYDTRMQYIYICPLPIITIQVDMTYTNLLSRGLKKLDHRLKPCPDCGKPEFWSKHEFCIPF